MAVPETPMHEDNLLFWAEYQIGFAWQIFPVKAIPVTHCMDQSAD
jgi:hypothetical protein